MANELFVDGICEIDDKTIESYFSRFGSSVKHYDSHRHRPTNSCCFALILFESFTAVDNILQQRPHQLNHCPVFVKRMLPAGTCSFIERLLPVSSLFVRSKINRELDDVKLRTYFNSLGRILKFERDHRNRDRLFIEFDDYDAVDQIFLNKARLPNYIEIHKNILPRAQNSVRYHGTCRRKTAEIRTEENKKKRHRKSKCQSDEQYQDLLQKAIEDLINCKAQLRNKDNDYMILQMEYTTIKEENEKLNQRLEDQSIKSCRMCEEHEITIARLQQTLKKLDERYETIKSQYQRLILAQHRPTVVEKTEYELPKSTSVRRQQYSLSTRLNYGVNQKYEASEKYLSQFNLPTAVFPDIVVKQKNPLPPILPSRVA